MKPMIHARSSAKKYGGKPEDYLPIHEFMDSTKSALADVRHRAILHSSFGCFIVEKVFGVELTNSDGKKYSPREVAFGEGKIVITREGLEVKEYLHE